MQKGIFVKIIFRTNGCLVVMNPMVEKAKNHPLGYVTSESSGFLVPEGVKITESTNTKSSSNHSVDVSGSCKGW